MTDLAVFASASSTLFAILGAPVWITPRIGARSQTKALITVPDRDEMVGDAPMTFSPNMRWIRLPSGITGDLVTNSGTTWALGRSPDPDPLGLSQQWIGVPLSLSVGTIAYHATGYPLVAWNGVEWVISN